MERLSIEQDLARAGYGHRRTPISDKTGKHAVYRLDTGEVLGEFDGYEATNWLYAIEERQDAALSTLKAEREALKRTSEGARA